MKFYMIHDWHGTFTANEEQFKFWQTMQKLVYRGRVAVSRNINTVDQYNDVSNTWTTASENVYVS